MNPLEDLFHACAWEAFMKAVADNKHHDSEYVRIEAYRLYEEKKLIQLKIS